MECSSTVIALACVCSHSIVIMAQVADVSCAVHICSLLHQRYAEFSTELLEQLQKIYTTGIGKDEDKVSLEGKLRKGKSERGEREV